MMGIKFDGFRFVNFIFAGACIGMFFNTQDFDYILLVFLLVIVHALKEIEDKLEELKKDKS